jgi:hypothetical protein
MNMAIKQGVFEEQKRAYYRGTKAEKGVILDALVRVTGPHEKGCHQANAPYATL